MKLRIVLVLFFSCVLVACAPRKPLGPSAEDSVAEARGLHQKFITAFNAGDADALSALYAKDTQATLFPPDEFLARGQEGIHGCFAALGKGMPGAHLSFTEEQFRAVGDGVFSWGLWEMKVPTKPKKAPMVMKGRYSEFWIRENGNLVLLSDHASVPLSKPAPSKVVRSIAKKSVKKS